MTLEVEIPHEAEVVQISENPTRAFACFDRARNALCVLLVGDPAIPPKHFSHDLTRYANHGKYQGDRTLPPHAR